MYFHIPLAPKGVLVKFKSSDESSLNKKHPPDADVFNFINDCWQPGTGNQQLLYFKIFFE